MCHGLPATPAPGDEQVRLAAPAANGWNVIEYAPPGPVALSATQREQVRLELDKARSVDGLRARAEKAEARLRTGAVAATKLLLALDARAAATPAQRRGAAVLTLRAVRALQAALGYSTEDVDRILATVAPADGEAALALESTAGGASPVSPEHESKKS